MEDEKKHGGAYVEVFPPKYKEVTLVTVLQFTEIRQVPENHHLKIDELAKRRIEQYFEKEHRLDDALVLDIKVFERDIESNT